MDILRKISDQGQIFLNEDMLNHLGLQKGDWIVLRDDDGKWGHFISMFRPTQTEHKKLVQLEEKGNDKK
jgi:hypothetical protein